MNRKSLSHDMQSQLFRIGGGMFAGLVFVACVFSTLGLVTTISGVVFLLSANVSLASLTYFAQH